MTTETPQTRPDPGMGALLGAGVAAALVAVLLVLLAALAGGTPAAYGALVGGVLVIVVLGSGSLVVNVVAGLMPSASLMIALLTYALQLVLMGVVLAALERSGLLEDALDRTWLGGAVITGVLVWTIAQIVLSTRLRIPAYDLPGDPPVRQSEAGAR